SGHRRSPHHRGLAIRAALADRGAAPDRRLDAVRAGGRPEPADHGARGAQGGEPFLAAPAEPLLPHAVLRHRGARGQPARRAALRVALRGRRPRRISAEPAVLAGSRTGHRLTPGGYPASPSGPLTDPALRPEDRGSPAGRSSVTCEDLRVAARPSPGR